MKKVKSVLICLVIIANILSLCGCSIEKTQNLSERTEESVLNSKKEEEFKREYLDEGRIEDVNETLQIDELPDFFVVVRTYSTPLDDYVVINKGEVDAHLPNGTFSLALIYDESSKKWQKLDYEIIDVIGKISSH